MVKRRLVVIIAMALLLTSVGGWIWASATGKIDQDDPASYYLNAEGERIAPPQSVQFHIIPRFTH